MKLYNFKDIDIMMMDIVDNDEWEVWNSIEKEKCAFKRFKERQIFEIAKEKLKKNKNV